MAEISVIIFLFAFGLAAFFTPLVRNAAAAHGFVDKPGERKIHERAVPYGGGIAIFIAFVVPVAAAYLIAWNADAFGVALPEAAKRHIPGMMLRLPLAVAIVLGGLALAAMGLLDDRRGLNKWLKLAVQVAVVTALFGLGVKITFFTQSPAANYALTLFWMVGIINAFNLLDNMDGLSAGVAFIASVLFFIIASAGGQEFVASMLLVLAGSLLGFLLYNFHPAGIFMGDAGSYFIGYLLAVLTTLSTFYRGGGESPLCVFFVPVMILAIPIFDTLSVIVIRLREGRPIMSPDKSHFSHRLVRLNLSVRQAVGTIYLVAVAMGLGAVLLSRLTREIYIFLALAQAVVIFSVIVILETAGAKKNGNDD